MASFNSIKSVIFDREDRKRYFFSLFIYLKICDPFLLCF